MNRLLIAVCIALALSLCLAAVSSAHKVNIFAYVDGDTVVTDCGYSRSQRVHDGTVEVYDAHSGVLLLSGTTDDDGKFSFPIPDAARADKSDLRLVLKAGTGHQSEWVVRYAEYGNAAELGVEPVSQTALPETPATTSSVASVNEVELEALVKAAVRTELEPVKRMLSELNQSGPTMTEIVGGVGWIFGLFGVAAYVSSRKKP